MALIEINDIDVKAIVADSGIGHQIEFRIVNACRDWVEANPDEPLPGTVISWVNEYNYKNIAVRKGNSWAVAGSADAWSWDRIKRASKLKYHIVRT